jgi:alpha-L-fucosidase
MKINRRTSKFLLLGFIVCQLMTINLLAQSNFYQPTWASVDTHPPAAEWFKDAKFGIWFHWGVYNTPAYGSEWYPEGMYGNLKSYHTSKYGDPSVWPYQNFINGANDKAGNWTQFAPKLKSAGGNFDPDGWAQLFVDAGAKIAGPVAEHHDGFSMWASKVNPWNALDKGPKIDLVKVLTDAFRAKNMKIICSSHHAYNFTGYFSAVPAQSDPDLKKLFGQLPKADQEKYWLDKLKELVDGYQPDYIWQDFNLTQITELNRLNFLSYYYNKAIDWNKEVVASYNDGFNTNGEVHQWERGGPDKTTYPYWMSEDAISSTTWGYTTGMVYYSSTQLLHELIDRVSKNGTMLLNISPMADGTIPQAQRTVLLGMGDWLKKFGESIYSTRAWNVFGEGPTVLGGGQYQTPPVGTAKDIRFTRNKSNTALYAIVLGWPGNGAQLKITSLAAGKFDISTVGNVSLLDTVTGKYINLSSYTQDATGLNITMPAAKPYTAVAYVIKISTNCGRTFNMAATASNVSQNMAIYNAAKAVDGDVNTRWATDANTKTAWLEIDLGGNTTFSRASINEAFPGRITGYKIQYWNGTAWLDAYTGTTTTLANVNFNSVTGSKVRLNITSVSGTQGPTINEFDICDLGSAMNVQQTNLLETEIQTYPNPFRESTAIQFRLNGTEKVSIRVYNVYGQLVNTLMDTKLDAGEHAFHWAGNDSKGLPVAGGMYYYSVNTSSQQITKPMIFLGK